MVLRVERRAEESQKSSVKYGFKRMSWLESTYGKKAEKIAQRKVAQGLPRSQLSINLCCSRLRPFHKSCRLGMSSKVHARPGAPGRS